MGMGQINQQNQTIDTNQVSEIKQSGGATNNFKLKKLKNTNKLSQNFFF
jgi:hypothetical protein